MHNLQNGPGSCKVLCWSDFHLGLRDWCAQELIDKAMDDYELIEEFYYNLSTDDFNAK